MTSWMDALPGSGEMLGRLRELDWAVTPLGAPEDWPERLRSAVSTALSSRFPLMVAWGPDLVQIYNDGYLPIFGEKHPQLGARICDTWAEIWDVVGPLLRGVLETREATWSVDQQLWIDRLGFPEDTYFTFSFSPLLDVDGSAAGVLATAMETTEQVISARRAAVLAAVRPGREATSAAAAEVTVEQLAAHRDDVPFALVYLREQDGGFALAASSTPGGGWAPRRVGCGSGGPWPLDVPAGGPLLVDVPADVDVVHEAAGTRVRQAALVRLGDHGTLVCGLSPGRRVNRPHLDFVSALAAQVQASLTVGRALAEERARAEERVADERARADREAERRRVADAERFRFAGARVGTWSVDLVTGEAVLDENLERMFGLQPGTMTTVDDVMSRVEPEHRDRVWSAMGQVGLEGGEFFVEFEVVRPDGARRAFQSRGVAAPDDEGRFRLLHGALWDATELLQAQAATRDADERLRTALEAAPWGSAIVEPDGRISRVNQALCDLTGWDRGELLRTAFPALLHPDDDGLGPEGHGAVREVRLIGAEGQEIWVTLSSAPVRAPDGSVLHFVVHVHDHTERKRLEADLQRLADHDPLTGLLNRRRFGEELDRALKLAGRGSGGALLMIDMDGLKHANDTLGHGVGDALLVALADALRARLRESDVCARLGGDEFAVIMPSADVAAALTLAEELLAHFARSGPLGMALSASVGITLLASRDDERSGEDVLTEADIALYVAKDAGVGQIRVFEGVPSGEPGSSGSSGSSGLSGLSGRVVSRPRRWTERIRAALDNDGFVLHAQPIRSLHAGAPDQSELLLRMLGDDGRLLLPTSFLLAAERSTLILEIDRWVVGAAVRELAARQHDGHPRTLTVNLSARSITDPGLARFIAAELADAAADPAGLVFEITETAAVVNVAQAHAFSAAMSSLGCAMSLDDFGAGFTSFQSLKQLDFDYLKLDGELVRDVAISRTNQCIVQSLAEMATLLGKRTVAEHVSDDETCIWLREHGVDYAQGFHLGGPEPLLAR